MSKALTLLLDQASALELTVAEIYDQLSEQFAENTTLSHFWALFAEAERYHSLIIQMQKLGMTQATSDTDRLDEWEGEIGETQIFLNQLVTRLKTEGWKPSIAEAFDLAQDIEGRSLEVQSRSFSLFESPAIKQLVTTLHQEDMQHRAKLISAKEKFVQ